MTTQKAHSPSLDKPWFCFDGDDYEYFATEAEAITAAEAAIQYFLDESWSEEVENIKVGKVTRIATKTNVVERPDELDEEGCDGTGQYWPDHISHCCDYEPLPMK